MDEEVRARRALLAARARTQHAVVDRATALASGLDASGLAREVAGGRLERLQAGAYRVAGAPGSWEQVVLAAVLAVGGDAVASHRSAARLWDLADGDSTVELSVRRGRGPEPRGAIVHRSSDLAGEWCTQRRGIPVTNPLRTLVDLGAVAPGRVVSDALERALVGRLVSVAAVERARAAHARPGRSGSGVLRRILDARALGDRPAESVLEARMAALLVRHGLPSVAFQHEVRAGGRFVARVDFAYPAQRVAIEVDGLSAHASAAALQHDLTRQNLLVSLGWTALRFTWPDVIRRPVSVASTIRDVLARAA